MRFYDFTVLYPYRPYNKNVVPALIGAAAAIGSSLITNANNRDNADRAYRKQIDYNQWLLSHQTQERVRDLRAAGLNPAFMNGSQLGSSPAPPSYDTPEYQSPLDLSTAMMFGKTVAETQNLKAVTRKTNADAEAQELLNADKRERNKELGKRDVVSYADSNGVPIEDLNKWLSEHGSIENGQELPDQIIITKFGKEGSEGKFQAEQIKKRWSGEVSRIDADMALSELDKFVASGQIKDKNVVDALINMPYRTFNKLVQDTKNALQTEKNLIKQGEILDINKVTLQLEQDIKRDSNLLQYVEKAFGGDFSWKDAAKLMVMAIVAGLQR